MIQYYKLFDLLNRRGMKKSDLRKILSPKTVSKLSKGEYISGEVIEKICLFLHCQPGDIMEVYEKLEDFAPGVSQAKYFSSDIIDNGNEEILLETEEIIAETNALSLDEDNNIIETTYAHPISKKTSVIKSDNS